MGVPIMDSCCFFISTRVGLLIYIYLKLILQAMIMLLFIVFKISTDHAVRTHPDDERIIIGSFLYDVIFYLTLISILIELPFNISGLVGAHKESLEWLNVYYYFSFLCVLLNIIGVVYQVFEGEYQIAIWVVIYMAINIYMLLVAKGEKMRLESRSDTHPNKFDLPPSKGSPIDSGYIHV